MLLTLLIQLAVLPGGAPAVKDQPFVPPKPPGRSIGLKAGDVKPATKWPDDAPVVGTYFFYWYDARTKEHWFNGDGSDALVDHPADANGYSYRNVHWWQRELRDVTAAGIDFIAPVYWGVPGHYEKGHFQWSFEGLKHLAAAWDRLAKADRRPPQIALFYDTSTLRHNGSARHVDLRTPGGKAWLYTTIRDFFSLVPPRMWAMRKGGPIIFLYSAAFAKAQDPKALDEVRRRFARDFACRPYIVREVSWQGRADAVYAWGGALGLKLHSVAALGPGYDHHAVPGRTPLVRKRRGGNFYRESWARLLAVPAAKRPRMVMVETWNELHEGTDVCATKEYGRTYIDLTAEHVRRYKRSFPPAPPRAPRR